MTGRDLVAVILAVALASILFAITMGVVFGGFAVTGEGVIGAIIGAMTVAVVRYLSPPRLGR